MKKILIFTVLCSACAACSPKENNQSQNEKNLSNVSNNAKHCDPLQNADSNITSRVKQALTSDHTLSASSRCISVTTTNGVVTLTGTISNSNEMAEIIRKVKNVNGVKKVDNQMTLVNP